MNNKRQLLGRWGEETAAKLLSKAGYQIIAKNYRCRQGEIDIIASDKETLVFVEVKLRTGLRFGRPEEAVDFKKLEKIKKTGLEFWKRTALPFKKARIDVVSLYFNADKLEGRIIRAVG